MLDIDISMSKSQLKYGAHNPRFCRQCSKPIPFKENAVTHYQRALFCGFTCYHAGRHALAWDKHQATHPKAFKRTCPTCRVVLVPRTSGKQKETMKAFLRRKHCSITCRNKAGYLERPTKRLTSHLHARAIAEKHFDMECSVCGKNKTDEVPIDVHHKDENPFNNELVNLLVLCRPCHRKEHAKISALRTPKCLGAECDRPARGPGSKFCDKHRARFEKWGHPDVVFSKGGGHGVPRRQVAGPPLNRNNAGPGCDARKMGN